MPKDKILKIMFFISLGITLLVPAVNYHFVYPFFTGLIIENTEEEAERTATHLQTTLLPDITDIDRNIATDKLSRQVEKDGRDFKFIKLKIFSNTGEVVYSSDKREMGDINKNEYFMNIVSQGRKYTKVVKKDTRSLEGSIIKADVVETYIPIMREGSFTGAFEIYYDITGRYQKLKKAVVYFSFFPTMVMIMFFSLIAVMIYRLDKNIIERKRAEMETIVYAEKLKMSNSELEDFAYIASHDLQEPLRKIIAFGERLKSKYSGILDEHGIDYIERMQNASKRMQILIEGLLMFSRVTTKGQPFVRVDLAAITRDVLSDLEVRIQESGGQVEIDKLPVLDADPLQMRQLMQNLISNALKFSQKGKPPVVRVRGEYIQEQDLFPDNNSKFCQITVEDNGIGFDEKYANRIFGMFQRLHGKQEYQGTGIGLSVCKKIVERHGGRITASSAPGKGAKFTVTLQARHDDVHRA